MIPVKILLLDDKEENIIALEALLQRDDVLLISTTSPNEALKLAWEHEISIALVDVQMPMMDGFEFVEILKSNPKTRDIIVVFVTAISKEPKYALKGFNSGAVDYLYKPLDPNITVAKVDAFIQLTRNQAEIKKKNEELQNFALIVKNSADIICTTDTHDFRILTINPAVEKILGYNISSVNGKSIIDFAINDQRPAFRTKLTEILTSGLSSSVFELQFGTFNKQTIWVECRVACQNKTLFFNISDISAQKNYQRQLIQLKDLAEQARKAKETFLANMSHELRTPINGIIGLTDIFSRTQLSEEQNHLINLLEKSSQSLLGVINDVLDISKIEAGKFSINRSANNLHDLVNAIYGLLKPRADKQKIGLVLKIDDEVPAYVMVDPLRLNQILMNLLSNAIKFTEHGVVNLTVTLLEKQNDRVKLCFNVEDSGIGIPPERLERIFDSYEQADSNTAAKYGGTGLGLGIVKKLVELKGGDLSVTSDFGKGSTFSFTNWYTVSAKPLETNGAATNSGKRFENVSILIAEDNPINQFMLAKMLKGWNIEVDLVDNGRKAIDKMTLKSYNLILMDTHMPDMDGYQATKIIRRDFTEPKKSVPIISLSASSLDHERQEAISAGMNVVLSKPFKPDELYNKIRDLLKID